MQSRYARIRLLVFVAAVSIASTCATVPATKDINVDDNDRLMPAARIGYEILPGMNTRRRGSMLDLVTGNAPITGARADGEKVKKATFTLGVVGEFATVDGQDLVDVPAGRNVQVGVEIPGPTVVDTRVENYRGHLSLRPGGRFFDIVSVEAILGVGIDDTNLRLRSPGFDIREQKTVPAFVSGFRLSVRPIPLFDLYGQVVAMVGRFTSADFEAGGQLNLTPNFGVYGGYRRWTYDKSSFQGSGSDLEVNFVGPTVGASLTF